MVHVEPKQGSGNGLGGRIEPLASVPSPIQSASNLNDQESEHNQRAQIEERPLNRHPASLPERISFSLLSPALG